MNIDSVYSKNKEGVETQFFCGDKIIKEGGDYTFEGIIVAIYYKLNPHHYRIVAENKEGLNFIFNPSQLRKL